MPFPLSLNTSATFIYLFIYFGHKFAKSIWQYGCAMLKNFLLKFIGHIFEKSGEIRVRHSCARKSQLNTGLSNEVPWLGLSTILKTVTFQ